MVMPLRPLQTSLNQQQHNEPLCCSGFKTLATNGIKNVTGGRSIRAGFGEKRQEAELEVAEIKMLSLSLGANGMDWIRSDDIRGTARVRCFGDKCEPRWFLVKYSGEIVNASVGGR